MGLRPAEKAKLVLWLCAARYLDPECSPCEDGEHRVGCKLLEAAQSAVDSAASSAELYLSAERLSAETERLAALPPEDATTAHSLLSLAEKALISSYLLAEAGCLAALPREDADTTAHLLVSLAEESLRGTAEKMRQHHEPSDGAAVEAERCDMVDFAAEIETWIRRLLQTEGCVPSGHDPAIKYDIALTDDGRDFAPFCINGETSIKRLPRTVGLTLKAQLMTARDFWDIAYTLHHELVCHAFQGASATHDLPDAHPRCHWSEGWMDTLAFDLVKEWGQLPGQWLPLRGEDAQGELWEFHDHRYRKPRLSPDDVLRRRRARDAYRRLVKTLVAYEICPSAEEANDIVRRFSLVANSHREASCHRLKKLGTRLRTLLLADARPQAGIAAARACLAFTVDRDLDKLEQALS